MESGDIDDGLQLDWEHCADRSVGIARLSDLLVIAATVVMKLHATALNWCDAASFAAA